MAERPSTRQDVDLLALWAGPHWRDEACDWALSAARRAGAEPTGEFVEVKTRAWSTVWKIPTSGKPLWFKENAPSQSFEAALIQGIASVAPHAVPPIVAVDSRRGWLLSADIGVPLWEKEAITADGWIDLLEAYAALQRTLESHVDELVATGVTLHAEDTLAPWVSALADELHALPATDVRSLSDDERRFVDANLFRLVDAAAELAVLPIPISLQHNDMHLGNAFRDEEGFTFIDFGDAVLSHPFAAARIPLWSLQESFGAEPGTGLRSRAEAAYLEVWTDLAPSAQLRRLLAPAERVACVHRAISWHRLQGDAPAHVFPADYLPAVKTWLLDALAPDPYVGSGLRPQG